MQDYNTIIGSIQMRLNGCQTRSVMDRYKIGSGTLNLIMSRYHANGIPIEELRMMAPKEVENLFYPQKNLQRKDVPLPDFQYYYDRIHAPESRMNISFCWLDYKEKNPDGYEKSQFYEYFNRFIAENYGGQKVSMAVNRIPGEKMYIDWVGDQTELLPHGTDTMEETAWFTHLTAKTQKPIVFTGAMRPATALSADGPLNLLNAVRIAADPKAAGRGVLVALNDVILSARDAMKISPTNAAAFGPNVHGPLGLIAGAEILWLGRPERAFGSETPFSIPKLAALEIPRVDIVYSHADDDGVMVRAACAAGARAIVHAGTGNGSIHCCTDEALADAADAGVLIIRASRVTTGAVTTGLAEWQERGYVPAGTLTPQKARVLAQLVVAEYGQVQSALAEAFSKY